MRNEAAVVAWVFIGAIAILASACSSVPSSGLSSAKTGRIELSEEFKNGEARLACQLHCAVTWALYRDRAKALYNARAWNELALNVLRIGYADDLSYFYLGKSAEGLGHYRAAERYYRLSRAASLKCADIYGDCYGFVFPRDARSAAPAVANKPTEIKRQYLAPPPPAPAQEPSGAVPERLAETPSDRGGSEAPAKEAAEPKTHASQPGRKGAHHAGGATPPEAEKRPSVAAAKKSPSRKAVQQAEISNSPPETKTPPAPSPAAAEKEIEPEPPPPSVTFEEVSRKFGTHSPLTEAQKREEWKKYRGRCVEWAGELSYVGDSFIRGVTLGFKHDPRTLTYDVLVAAPDDARNAALRMKRGSHYTYRGTLKKYGGAVLPISMSWGCSGAKRDSERAKAE
jgi:hypothetical protein